MRLGRVLVANASMLPTYRHDDRLVVLYGSRRARPGDVVLVRRADALMIKRIASVGAEGITVLSDNALAGTDSRSFGPVPREAVIARVLGRYWRAQRW